jgi:hypothetical protein
VYVAFATPCLSHHVTLEYFNSYMATSYMLSRANIVHTSIQVGGNCFVAMARNLLVHKFLVETPEATDLFFIDDDVGWQPDAVRRLLESDLPVVAAVYPKKQDPPAFPVELMARNGGDFFHHGGFYEATFVGMGFTRMHRDVLELMSLDVPSYRETDARGKTYVVPEVFKAGVINGTFVGEDADFCYRWARLGGSIMVDPTITLSHTGHKTWTGTLMDGIEQFRRDGPSP